MRFTAGCRRRRRRVTVVLLGATSLRSLALIPFSRCSSFPRSTRDLVGFAAGLASICCWVVAQMPQLYRNYRTQSAEALSPWFLAEWLLVGAGVAGVGEA